MTDLYTCDVCGLEHVKVEEPDLRFETDAAGKERREVERLHFLVAAQAQEVQMTDLAAADRERDLKVEAARIEARRKDDPGEAAAAKAAKEDAAERAKADKEAAKPKSEDEAETTPLAPGEDSGGPTDNKDHEPDVEPAPSVKPVVAEKKAAKK